IGCFDSACSLPSIHYWHAHIHPDQMRLPLFPNGNGFLTIGCFAHIKAEWLKRSDNKLAAFPAIVDSQNTIASLIGRQGGHPPIELAGILQDAIRLSELHRDVENRRRALFYLALELEFTAHQL